MAAAGIARLCLLRVNAECVAILYGFRCGKTFQFYQSGMHPGWSAFGIGLVNMGNSIRQAIAEGCDVFDFLRGDESYKARWTPLSRRNLDIRIFTRRPSGGALRLGFYALHSARALKHLLECLARRLRPGSTQHGKEKRHTP